MKKTRLIPPLPAAASSATAAIFNACSKQESTLNPVNEQELSPWDLKINNTIKNFGDKVSYLRENPGYKSSESYAADSALCFLEATINYSHSFPNDYYGQMLTDTLYLTLSTNDAGEVDMNELALKYDAVKAAISEVYHSKTITDKGSVLVNLEDISFKSDQMEIEVVAVTGERTNEPPGGGVGIDGPFSHDDNWWWGESGGLCSENYGDDGSDAAQELYKEIILEIPDLEENSYYINTVDYTIEGGNPLIRRTEPEDNHLDYLLFYASTEVGPCTHDTLCVEWPEMNFYYHFLKQLIFTYLPENVPELNGLEVKAILNLGAIFEHSDGNEYYVHRIETIYGFKVNYPPGEEPIELQ